MILENQRCFDSTQLLKTYFHWICPLGRFRHRVAICLSVCLSGRCLWRRKSPTYRCSGELWSKNVFLILYLYYDERRDIQWNIGGAWGISCGLRLYFIIFPDSSHNTDILNYRSSIGLSGRSIWEELLLRIAPTAGQYGEILPSRLSNAGELNFNIIMFSNWEQPVMTQSSNKKSGLFFFKIFKTHGLGTPAQKKHFLLL